MSDTHTHTHSQSQSHPHTQNWLCRTANSWRRISSWMKAGQSEWVSGIECTGNSRILGSAHFTHTHTHMFGGATMSQRSTCKCYRGGGRGGGGDSVIYMQVSTQYGSLDSPNLAPSWRHLAVLYYVGQIEFIAWGCMVPRINKIIINIFKSSIEC